MALATFCLTPYNVLLLDEPTNHLDVDAIAALLDAIETYIATPNPSPHPIRNGRRLSNPSPQP